MLGKRHWQRSLWQDGKDSGDSLPRGGRRELLARGDASGLGNLDVGIVRVGERGGRRVGTLRLVLCGAEGKASLTSHVPRSYGKSRFWTGDFRLRPTRSGFRTDFDQGILLRL